MGNKKYVIVGYVILVFIILILTLHLRQKYNQVKNSEMNRLTAEALLESYIDNTQAIRIAEAAYKKGLPEPSSRTYQVLSEIGYSSFSRPFYIVKLEHHGPINSASFSLDESKKLTVLTASEDGTIKFWSQDGKSIFELNEHLSRITQVSFSTDGKKVLTASADGTAKLLNLKDQSIKIFQHHGVVSSAVFSPEGEDRVLTGSWDKTAKLWNLEGKLLQNINGHSQALSSAVFSPDGKFIITASWDSTASVWDLNGNKIASMNHDSGLSDAQFFPDNKTILSASDDGVVKVWNLQENLLFEDKNNSIISAIAISPDGKNFCASSEDGFCRIWQLEQNWKLTSEWKQDGVVTKIEFSRDNCHIITASSDGKARIYKINGVLQAVLPHLKAVLSASFSADGTLAVTSSEDGTTKMWELKNDLVSVIEPKQGEVSQALYSPDGENILVAFRNSSIVQLLNNEGKYLKEFRTSGGIVSSIAFSPDSQLILLGSTDGKLKLYGNNTKLETNFPEDFALSALFSPDGKKILLNLVRGKSVIWSLLDNSEINLKHENPISISSISTQGDKVLTISDDMITKTWDMNGVKLNRFSIGVKAVNADFSGDGKLIRVILKSGKIKEWAINGQPGKEIILTKHLVHSAVFSLNGERVLLGMEDGHSLLYRIDGKLLGDSNIHKTPISYISYSSDGMKFITISRDTAIVQVTPEGILGWLKDSRIPELNGKYPEKNFD